MGIPSEYVEERIQTLFLDGQPVDDVERALVRDGTTLTLSAAMPGFAGATMRKGGYYAKMRNAITYREGLEGCQQGRGRVVLKLFNLIIRELGPDILKKGIWLRGEDLKRFFEGQTGDFWEGCRGIHTNSGVLERDLLAGASWAERVLLQIHPAG
jgi:hypothetical protein